MHTWSMLQQMTYSTLVLSANCSCPRMPALIVVMKIPTAVVPSVFSLFPWFSVETLHAADWMSTHV